jgi:hypothetical protein
MFSEEPTEILEEPKDAEIQRRVLEWKFSSLDTNNDQQLERHEYRGLRRLVRKVVPPRRCARTFTRTCDLNHDEKLSREEWTACLGVDFNSEYLFHFIFIIILFYSKGAGYIEFKYFKIFDSKTQN